MKDEIKCDVCEQTYHKNDVDVTLLGNNYWHTGDDGLVHCMGDAPKPPPRKWKTPYQLSYDGRRNLGDYERH